MIKNIIEVIAEINRKAIEYADMMNEVNNVNKRLDAINEVNNVNKRLDAINEVNNVNKRLDAINDVNDANSKLDVMIDTSKANGKLDVIIDASEAKINPEIEKLLAVLANPEMKGKLLKFLEPKEESL